MKSAPVIFALDALLTLSVNAVSLQPPAAQSLISPLPAVIAYALARQISLADIDDMDPSASGRPGDSFTVLTTSHSGRA